jgi:hypothetical protein
MPGKAFLGVRLKRTRASVQYGPSLRLRWTSVLMLPDVNGSLIGKDACSMWVQCFCVLCIISNCRQAAKFGRGFLDLYNPTDFVNMGQTLKVMNSIRSYDIGIPLTLSQSVSPKFQRGFLSYLTFCVQDTRTPRQHTLYSA